MADYKPCSEFDRYNDLIEKYWITEKYRKCFDGHLILAEQGYSLAECRVGYFYYEGLGVEKDLRKCSTPDAVAPRRMAMDNAIWLGFMKTAKYRYQKSVLQNP